LALPRIGFRTGGAFSDQGRQIATEKVPDIPITKQLPTLTKIQPSFGQWETAILRHSSNLKTGVLNGRFKLGS
jgi:hypothetical protein